MKFLLLSLFLLTGIPAICQVSSSNLPQENQAEAALENGNYPTAIRLYEEALEIRKAKYPGGVDSSLRSLMEISNAIDNLVIAYGKAENYEKQVELCEEQSSQWRSAMQLFPDKPSPYLEYGLSQIQMAESFQSLLQYDKALSVCEDLIYFYEHPNGREPFIFVAKQIIPFAHSRAGEILKDKGDLQASVMHHEKSVTYWLEALKKLDERLYYEKIAQQSEICVQRFGKLEDSLNVIKYAEIAVKYYEILTGMEPENEEYIQEVMSALNTLGIYKSGRGDYQEAIMHFQKSLKINQKQYDQDSNIEYLNQMAAVNLKISQCYKSLHDTKGEAQHLSARIELLQKYQDLNSSLDYSYTISGNQYTLAKLYEKLTENAQALAVLEESIAMGQVALQKDPDNVRKKQWQWIQEFYRYQLLRKIREYETAKSSLDRLTEIFTTLESDEPGIQYSEHLNEVEISKNELDYPDIVVLDAEIEALDEGPLKFEKTKALIQLMKKKMKKDPSMKLSYVKHTSALAWTGLMTGNYKESIKALKKAMRVKPVDPYLITNYAPCLLFMGKYKKAEKVYRKYYNEPFKPGEKIMSGFLDDLQVFEEEGKIPEEHQQAVHQIKEKLTLWDNE